MSKVQIESDTFDRELRRIENELCEWERQYNKATEECNRLKAKIARFVSAMDELRESGIEP